MARAALKEPEVAGSMEEIILKATGEKPQGAKESREDFLLRCVDAVASMKEAAYGKLAASCPDVEDWYNKCAEVVKKIGDGLQWNGDSIDFLDVEVGDEIEADAEPVGDVDPDADTPLDDDDTAPEEPEGDTAAEPVDEAPQDDPDAEPAPEPVKRGRGRPPKAAAPAPPATKDISSKAAPKMGLSEWVKRQVFAEYEIPIADLTKDATKAGYTFKPELLKALYDGALDTVDILADMEILPSVAAVTLCKLCRKPE